ncbi:MAG: hypothetical protein FJ298_15055 [Planctomycetes bacterium]|nr:hypothetical protein [Planctomycetota bacterium]
MKSIAPLALVASAVASLAFARSPAQEAPLERLAALEKELAELKAKVAGLEQGGANTELGRALAEQRMRGDALAEWARAQGSAAATFQSTLQDARVKGFTAGINPASREALLSGFETLAAALRKPPTKEVTEPTEAAPKRPPQRRGTPAK